MLAAGRGFTLPTARRAAPAGVCSLLLLATCASAQDLDPRAYAKVPINSTVAVAGLSFSKGGVLTDPAAAVQNIEADVTTTTLGVVRTFALCGKTAQALAVFPYTWGDVTGNVFEEAARTTRSGAPDMRFRLAVLLAGAPAMRLEQFVKSPRKPIVGASVTVVAPTGQYYPAKMINLGTNRWSVKPEVALSVPLGPRWMADVYAGLWLFTDNGAYYPGTATRAQDPIGALQAHISYSLSPRAWVAFDSTWYAGGRATVNGVAGGPRQSNTRIGATLLVPVGKRHAVKVAWSTGAIVRSGADFDTVSVGWTTGWVDPRPRAQ
jgi:hypothetical protein